MKTILAMLALASAACAGETSRSQAEARARAAYAYSMSMTHVQSTAVPDHNIFENVPSSAFKEEPATPAPKPAPVAVKGTVPAYPGQRSNRGWCACQANAGACYCQPASICPNCPINQTVKSLHPIDRAYYFPQLNCPTSR